MTKFANSVSGAMLSPSLIQVTESISWSVVALAMFALNIGHGPSLPISNDHTIFSSSNTLQNTLTTKCQFHREIQPTIRMQGGDRAISAKNHDIFSLGRPSSKRFCLQQPPKPNLIIPSQMEV